MKIRTFMFVAMMLFASFAVAQETPADTPPSETVPKEEKSAGTVAKERFLFAMVDFLDMSKEALREGGSMAKDGIKTGVKFAKEQVPIVLQEVIAIRRAETLTYFLITILVIVMLHYGGKKVCNSKLAQNRERITDGYGAEMGTVGGWTKAISIIVKWIGTGICIIAIVDHARDWLLPWVAPRVYLIEYAMELIEKIKG